MFSAPRCAFVSAPPRSSCGRNGRIHSVLHPVVNYVAVQSRRTDQSLQSALRRVGASWGTAAAYGWACLCLVPLLASSWLLLGLIPEGVLSGPDLLIARFTSFALVIGAILRAVGEEVFFRGLLAGVLIRRLGF